MSDGLSEDVRQHVHSLFFDQMKICGCGLPELTLELVRDLLTVIEERGRTETVIPHEGARHIVLSVLDNIDLIEHGSIIDAAWLTKKGRWYLRALQRVEWEDIEDEGVGLPHDGTPCTEACLKPFWIQQ